MKYLSAILAALSLTAATHAADLKIGVVDMGRVLDEYHETAAAKNLLGQNKARMDSEMQEMLEKLKKLDGEAKQLMKEARDPVLSEQIRAKKASEFEAKANELRSLSEQLEKERRRREQQLQTEAGQQRQKIYGKVVGAVAEKAKADGYDMVFDKSSVGVTGFPVLLHAKEGVMQDFTSEVIVQLNKDAPAGAATAPAPAPAEPVKEKKGKK
ncbi:periplasmic chaperone for outer membrane proteins Skp [Roseimicrobium gellanilyticum]|uniref:Periplasmic chaperone for outer membrane proteins Skp n=1 Tax=Roseimicrobium gellanilyticum TaxID=748857 RepID=A0A366HTL5_9BACT|nr:OmpH family outer membrane protein [Roseimicrobium gellanilyticum]RBP47427.1 periplasmic chaperone for outer membrane proteins Skp [Roseimicrobium gellanilyticum]